MLGRSVLAGMMLSPERFLGTLANGDPGRALS
jgi:hypothetical protein